MARRRRKSAREAYAVFNSRTGYMHKQRFATHRAAERYAERLETKARIDHPNSFSFYYAVRVTA
jgi:hypothetical protein